MTSKLTAVLYLVAGVLALSAAYINLADGNSRRAFTLGAAAVFCMVMAFVRGRRKG